MSDPRFPIGAVVTHRANGARGVVVGCTPVDVAGLPASYEYDVRGGFGCEAQVLECELAAVYPPNRFDCAECGHGIAVDEDGCCTGCGADARAVLATPDRPLRVGDRVSIEGVVTEVRSGDDSRSVVVQLPAGVRAWFNVADLRRVAAGEGERDG